MKQLVQAFLEQRLSRREFGQALAALGVAASSVESIVRAAEQAAQPESARIIEGTGGEILVQQLIEAGIEFVFTNPGSFEVGFFEALYGHRDRIHAIVGLHEGLVIAMADGYHKVSRQPGFVNVHTVAGTAQAAGQMYNASRDGSALMVTAGLLDNEAFSDNIILGARPGHNQKEINRQFTKLSWESHDTRGVGVMVRRALTLASAPPSGPVYLAFPNTVLQGVGKAEILPKERFTLSDQIAPDPEQVDELAKMLLTARQPALILGDEVYKAEAMNQALELAELLSLPVHTKPLPAFHSFPQQHPLCRGEFTSYDKEGKPKGLDFVLNVGEYDVGEYDSRERVLPVPDRPLYEPGTRVARFGLDPSSMGRDTGFDLAMLANVRLTLAALIEALKRRGVPADRTWKGQRRKPVELDPKHRGLDPLHPDELGWALEQVLDHDAIVVTENLSGSNGFLSTGGTDAKLWVSNSGASLGWGIGAATGAKIAAPGRQVVCNIGDGSVMYSAAGFWTQARYRVPVLTVVCNNLNYQTVRFAYCHARGKMFADNQFIGMYLGDPEIDFVKLAQSQGVDGVKVRRSDELLKALQQGVAQTKRGNPYLVEVVVRTIGEGAGSTWHEGFQVAGKQA